MADEIEIVNVGGENGVASEVTLEKLVKAVEKMAKSKGLDPKETTKKLEDLNKEIEDTVDVVTENRDALEENTDALDDNTDSVNRFGQGMSLVLNAMGSVAGSVLNLGSELVFGGDKLSDFANHIPLVGSYLGTFTGHLDETFETFRNLSSSGASFGNSMQDLMRAAAGARMGVDEFGALVLRNSSQLAAFGGTVTQGAKSIAQMQSGLGSMRNDLLNMGFTFEEINEGLIRYQYLNRAGSRSQVQDQQALALAAGEYMKNLSTLSKLTGDEIDTIEDSVQARSQEIAFQQALAKMAPDERAKVMAAMAEATQIYGDAGAEFFQQQILGMPPLTRETQLLAAMMPDLASQISGMARSATDASVSLEAFNAGSTDRLVGAVRAAAEAGEDFESLLAAGAAGLDGPGAELASILQGMGIQFTDYINRQGDLDEQALRRDIEAARAETNRRGELTSSMASFNEQITAARRTIQEQFINSGIYSHAAGMVQQFADLVASPMMVNAIETLIDLLGDFADSVFGFFEGFSAADDPKEYLMSAVTSIGSIIKDYLFGSSAEDQEADANAELGSISEQGQRFADRLSEIQNRLMRATDPNEIRRLNSEYETIQSQLVRNQERANELTANIASGFEDTPGVITSAFESMFGDMSLITKVALGAAGLFAASSVVNAVKNGITGLLGMGGGGERRGRSAGGRAAGGIGRGIGAGLRGLAGGLTALTPAIPVIGVLTLAAIGLGTALRIAAPAIEAFGTAIKSILEGAAPVIEAFAPLVESLGNALRNAFSGVAEVITSFAAPIEAALGGISSVVTSVGTAIEGALNGVATVAENLGNAISAPITAAGDAIQGVINSINEYKTAGIEATTNQIERLSNIPGNNLIDAARGIEMMKTALDGFAPSTWEGLTDWFTGGARQDSMVATTSVITDMASAFADLDPAVVERASLSVASLSTALQSFNQATAIEGVGDLASRLLGYEDAANAIVVLATSLENINGENLTNVAPGIISIAGAVGEFQALTSISNVGEGVSAALRSYVPLAHTVVDVATSLSTIETPENLSAAAEGITDVTAAIDNFQTLTTISSVGEGVSAALQSYKPLAETVVDVATNLSAIENPENLSQISPALTSIINAIDSFQALTSISSLGEGVSTVLDSYSAVTTPLIELINALEPIDGTQLQNVAPGIEAVSNALTVFKNSTGFSGLGDLVSSWFSGDALEVGANIKAIADDLSGIDAVKLTNVSTAIIAMSNAFEVYSGAEIDNLSISRNFVSRVNDLGNAAAGLERTNTALASIAAIEGIGPQLAAIQESLNADGVNAYADAMERLVEVLGDLNDELSQDNNGRFTPGTGVNAGTVVGQTDNSQSGRSEQIETLNSTMERAATLLSEIRDHTRRTSRRLDNLGQVY